MAWGWGGGRDVIYNRFLKFKIAPKLCLIRKFSLYPKYIENQLLYFEILSEFHIIFCQLKRHLFLLSSTHTIIQYVLDFLFFRREVGGGGKGVFSLKFIIGRVGREVESAKQCKRLLIDLLKEFLISL